MRQMDGVSGLINVLAGPAFSGRSDEGVHKSDLDICSVSKTGVTLVWSPHSCRGLYSWMIQPSKSDTKVNDTLFPTGIQINRKASQTLCVHKFITKHNGTPSRRRTENGTPSQGQTYL